MWRGKKQNQQINKIRLFHDGRVLLNQFAAKTTVIEFCVYQSDCTVVYV